MERLDRCAVTFERMTPSGRAAFADSIQTLELLASLCEGHHRPMQDWVREQPKRAISVDLVGLVCDTLAALAEKAAPLRRMEDLEVELIGSCLRCAAELCEGPCPGNQLRCTHDGVFLAALDKVMQSVYHPRVDPLVRLKVLCKPAPATWAFLKKTKAPAPSFFAPFSLIIFLL
jgi:hypothetical protein